MDFKSIKIVSNNYHMCFEEKSENEVEQILEIDASGNVWFTAINFEQFFGNSNPCREEHLSIGKWQAKHLFNLMWTMEKPVGGTDAGSICISIELGTGKRTEIYGTLYEFPKTFYGINTITVSKVMRRYIPIDDLWGLYGSLSPDYDGREEIRLFSEKWCGRFSQGEDAILPFGHDFARECKKLGFQMDCSEEFNHIYSNYFGNDNEELDKATFEISELDLLGSAAYSKWLLTTQKTYPYHLDEETCHWFTTILNQMEKLTR